MRNGSDGLRSSLLASKSTLRLGIHPAAAMHTVTTVYAPAGNIFVSLWPRENLPQGTKKFLAYVPRVILLARYNLI